LHQVAKAFASFSKRSASFLPGAPLLRRFLPNFRGQPPGGNGQGISAVRYRKMSHYGKIASIAGASANVSGSSGKCGVMRDG
jgi:hypothetical protein